MGEAVVRVHRVVRQTEALVDRALMLDKLEGLAVELVGHAGLENAQNCLKQAMLETALRRTGGNYARAAELLGVRRQAIQQMVSRYGLRDWAHRLRRETRRVTPC